MEKTVETSKKNAKTVNVVAKAKGANLAPANGTAKLENMETILQKIERLEQLKKHYDRLKYKQSDLQKALEKIKTFKSKKSDKFEQEEVEEFPYVIVLKGKGDYDRFEEIFTINQPETVENFTAYLLNEVDQVVEVFKTDLQEQTKNLGN